MTAQLPFRFTGSGDLPKFLPSPMFVTLAMRHAKFFCGRKPAPRSPEEVTLTKSDVAFLLVQVRTKG